MDEGRKVWVPDPVNGYVIGCIKDIGSDTITVEPRSSPEKTISASYDQVFLSEEYEDNDVDDNCKLLHNILNSLLLYRSSLIVCIFSRCFAIIGFYA